MLNIFSQPGQEKKFRTRLYFLLRLFLAFLVLLILKIASIQIFQRTQYQKYAQGQVEQKIRLKADRGRIYDRNGQILVDNRPAYSLYVTPAYLNRKQKSFQNNLLKYLSLKLDQSLTEIQNKTTMQDDKNQYTPVLLDRDMDPGVYVELLENSSYLEGLEIDVSSFRRYVLGEALAHVVGYTGFISREKWLDYQKNWQQSPEQNPYRSKETIVGKWGLEKLQDSIIRGRDGFAIRRIDARGKPASGSVQVIQKSQRGRDLFLTIDRELQSIAYQAMKNRKGALIVSKPATGEILALVSHPSFNPNALIRGKRKEIQKITRDPNHSFYDRAIQGTYPPSSIFKIILAIAALEEGKANTATSFTCEGGIQLGNRFFGCWRKHGKVNLIEAIEQSCNSYFYQLGSDLGWETIYRYAKLFGLGKGHTLEIGRVKPGNIPNAEWKKKYFQEEWFKGDTFNHSIGQGYSLVHPIELHNIISILANEGTLMQPYLIQKIVHPVNLQEQKTTEKILNKVSLKPETIDLIQKALRGVVLRGTAPWANYSLYPVAGKTGTAQDVLDLSPHAWFTAYAPFDEKDPKKRIAITVVVENTKGGGGFIASPIATAIFKYYFEKSSLEESQKQMNRYLFAPSEPIENEIITELTTKKEEALPTLQKTTEPTEEDTPEEKIEKIEREEDKRKIVVTPPKKLLAKKPETQEPKTQKEEITAGIDSSSMSPIPPVSTISSTSPKRSSEILGKSQKPDQSSELDKTKLNKQQKQLVEREEELKKKQKAELLSTWNQSREEEQERLKNIIEKIIDEERKVFQEQLEEELELDF